MPMTARSDLQGSLIVAGLAGLVGLVVTGVSCIPQQETSGCNPECRDGYTCNDGECEPTTVIVQTCNPSCEAGYTCESGDCVEKECSPSCSEGFECDKGRCVQVGGEDDGCSPPCRSGFSCQDGQCVSTRDNDDEDDSDADDEESGRSVGEACTDASQCSTDLCLSGETTPDGYCSTQCGGQTSRTGSDCPTGSICTQITDEASVCLVGCSDESDCRSGYGCFQEDGSSVCWPKCSSDGDCGDGQYCETASGRCKERGSSGHLGSTCASRQDCNSEVCITEEDSSAFTGGMCVSECTEGQAGQLCNDGDGLCLDFSSDGDPLFLCLQNCTTGTECRDGYICSSDVGIETDSGHGYCYPHCNNYQCESAMTCTASGICETDDGGGSGDVTIEHREIWSGATDSQSVEEVDFSVPSDAASFQLAFEPDSYQTTAVIAELSAPNGETLYSANQPTNSKAFLVPYNTDEQGYHSVLYPNTPQLNLPSGTYTLRFGSLASTTTTVDLLLKRGSPPNNTTTLPLTVWITPQPYIDAGTAAQNTKLQNALDKMETIYQRAGIEIGNVSYRALTGSQAQDLSVLEIDEMPELFPLLDASRAEGLNFVFIDHFNTSGGVAPLGRSDGIPGPPDHSEIPPSGVVVAASELSQGDADHFGAIMAHEGGHYLGLFHTTEQQGNTHDPIRDTPECGASYDTNGDGYVSANECQGTGASNFMFWQANQQFPKEVTGGQEFVLERNPSAR